MSLMLILHIVFLLLWSAALLYFPLLLAKQAGAEDDDDSAARTIFMQRLLYAMLMTPSALLTVAAGAWLIFERGFSGGWLPVKLALVLGMVMFHVWCGAQMAEEIRHRVPRRRRLFGWIWLFPLLLITGVVYLVTAKPF